MHIDKIFDVFKEKQTEYHLKIDKSWTQGRTIYGGLSAALTYQAAESLVDEMSLVRSLHTNFIGPIFYDQPIVVKAEILRKGKNVTQVVSKVMQNGNICTMSQICFGINRDSKLNQPNVQSHIMKIPNKGKFIPQLPKLVPEFIQHFDLSLTKGHLAFIKSDEAHLYGWSRLKKTPNKMNIAYLIALMDVWPPTMFQLTRMPAPASTMSWNIEFIQPDLILSPEKWIASETEARHIKDGYGHEEAKFWDQEGNLLALSRQVVAVFT